MAIAITLKISAIAERDLSSISPSLLAKLRNEVLENVSGGANVGVSGVVGDFLASPLFLERSESLANLRTIAIYLA